MIAPGLLWRCSWPAHRVHEALSLLMTQVGDSSQARDLNAPPKQILSEPRQFAIWLETVGENASVAIEEVEALYPDIPELVRNAGPALIQIPMLGENPFLVVLRSRGMYVQVLDTRQVRSWIHVDEIVDQMRAPLESQVSSVVDRSVADITGRQRRTQGREAILNQLLCDARIGGCWTIRCATHAGLWSKVKEAGVPWMVGKFLTAQIIASNLYVGAWWLLGSMLISGRLEWGWLLAWILLITTMIPFRILSAWYEGLASLHAGAILKREILHGALKMDPDEVREFGSGQWLGHVIEAENLESSALSGSFQCLQGMVDLALAAAVLACSSAPMRLLVALLACLGWILWRSQQWFALREKWTDLRLRMTGDLVEKLTGHRTRRIQEPLNRWNEGEDAVLARYISVSHQLDSLTAHLRTMLPRFWLLGGFVVLTPSFLAGAPTSQMALSVGGILLAQQAIRTVLSGIESWCAALIGWRRVQPFVQAAVRAVPRRDPILATLGQRRGIDGVEGEVVLEGTGLDYHYPARGQAVLAGVELQVRTGDRILVEGTSGAGKSTLAALLGGTRRADRGLLLLHGLDEASLGERAWGRQIVVAPQFHDNHVLSGTLAFNALLGCDWPPQPAELAEAERVLRGLDLGGLLDRMPAGLFQTVGETGWQLSHGEKSRLFVARALLQQPRVIILDECFAALDPETLERTMEFVRAEASTLMVIAHP